MMKFKLYLLALILVVIPIGYGLDATCGQTISSSGNEIMNNDITCNSQPGGDNAAIVINAKDVILDCNYKKITLNDDVTGIIVKSIANNTVIRNCIIDLTADPFLGEIEGILTFNNTLIVNTNLNVSLPLTMAIWKGIDIESKNINVYGLNLSIKTVGSTGITHILNSQAGSTFFRQWFLDFYLKTNQKYLDGITVNFTSMNDSSYSYQGVTGEMPRVYLELPVKQSNPTNGTRDGYISDAQTIDTISTTFKVGDDMIIGYYRAFIDFNTSVIPDGANIHSIKLQLTTSAATNSGSITVVGLNKLSKDFNYTTLGTACGGGAGGSIVYNQSTAIFNGVGKNVSGNITLNINATLNLSNQLINDWFSVGLYQIGDSLLNGNEVDFHSNESYSDYIPKLYIEYTPPTSGYIRFNITQNYTTSAGTTDVSTYRMKAKIRGRWINLTTPYTISGNQNMTVRANDYIWAGGIGADGTKLFRYNASKGYNETIFTAIDSPYGVRADLSNNIWVGSSIGDYSISMFNYSNNYSRHDFSSSDTPYQFAVDSKNNIWVIFLTATPTLTMLNASAGYIATINYTTGSGPYDIAIDSMDNVWVANSGDDDVSFYNASNSYTRTDYAVGDMPYTITIDQFDNLWGGNFQDKDVSLLNASNGYSRTDYAVSNKPWGISVDSKNNIWAGDWNYGGGTLEFTVLNTSNGYSRRDLSISDAVGSEAVREITIDSSDNIWFTYGYMYSMIDYEFAFLNSSNNYSLSYTHDPAVVMKMAQDMDVTTFLEEILPPIPLITHAPNVDFYYQRPPDLNLSNFITYGVNITYNITDQDGDLDNTTIKLYYKSNTTTSDIMFYVNGTAFGNRYYSKQYIDNVTNTYRWNLADNELLPGTYNYGEITLENTVHLRSNLSASNIYLSNELINISNQAQYSFFEFMANRTRGTGPLQIYYCNSTYTTGNPTSNTNCANFFTLNTNAYSHCHTTNSCHVVAPFAINQTSGKINGVYVTSKSYFLLRSISPTTTWTYYYIPNDNGRGATRTTTNNGASWTTQTYTIDSHMHQYALNSTSGVTNSLWYYACANDTTQNQNCSPVRQDLFEALGLNPDAPFVYSPTNITYRAFIPINYTQSISPNAYAISHYNITLLNSDLSTNRSLVTNNSLNLSYYWNSSTSSDGSYYIRVDACDSQAQCSYGLSELFNVDNTAPNIINLAVPASTCDYAYIGFNCSEACNYTLLYYKSSELIDTLKSTSYAITYTVLLSSLSASTTYITNLTVWDLIGNSNTNNTFNFTTSTCPSSTTSSSSSLSTGSCIGFADSFKRCYHIDASDLTCRIGCDPGYVCNASYRCVLPLNTTVYSTVHCLQFPTIIERLTDTCRILDGICSDGEDPIVDNEDCGLTQETWSCKGERCAVKEIWFLKLMIIIFIMWILFKRRK